MAFHTLTVTAVCPPTSAVEVTFSFDMDRFGIAAPFAWLIPPGAEAETAIARCLSRSADADAGRASFDLLVA